MAGAFPQKPAVQGPVNDLAGLLNGAQILELQHMLVDFADSTSNQICVVTVNSLEGMSASQFAIKIGLDWQVGSEEFNNGVVFLVKPRNSEGGGEVFLAVGRGLEGAIPDIYCHRIVNEIVIPYFADGDFYNGIKAGCVAIMQLANGEYHKAFEGSEEDDGFAAFLAFIVILIMVIVVICIANKRNGGNNHGNNGGSGRGGRPFIFVNPGSSSFGGSMGGFGGSSHGGGFSGGFSGGFGGGSFGGGGAGGRF